MTKRVVITGSECTGKTTLALVLASQLDAPWVAEASRAYAESRGGVLGADDVEPIAHAQIDAARRVAEANPGAPVIVYDTDLVSTVVYARAYYGSCPGWIEERARAQLGDLYLLCAPDLPWEADGVRDRPGDAARAEMHEAFADTLQAFGAHTVLVRGTGDARTAVAMESVRTLLATP